MTGPVLVVGLGNPGPRYAATRHNVGFMVLDALADALDARFAHDRGQAAEVAEARIEDRHVVLVKPTTYMNLSGEAVAPIVRWYKTAPEDVIVVHDEVDLPLCELRAKRGGGTGGHNGLRSLVSHLGTSEFVRLRFGVGRPPGRKDTAAHVLEPFTEREWEDVAPTVGVAADRVRELATIGFERLESSKAAQPPSSRRIKLIVSVAEPIDAVWDRWTTLDGVTSFFAPAAVLGAARGEPYEILFRPHEPPGSRGNEGGVLITVDPPKRLAFTWTAPPDVPRLRAAGDRTRVSILLKRKGPDQTLVTLTHTGFGDGADHDANLAYFEDAWPVVLERLQAVAAGKLVDWETRRIVEAPASG